MARAGVELLLDVLCPGGFQAVNGALDAFALLAHRVGVAGQEKQGQVFWHPGQNRWVVQPQDAGEHAVVGVQGEREHAALIGAVLVHLGGVAVEPVLRGAALQTLVVPGKREAGHQFAAVLPAEEDGQHPADGFCQLHQGFGLETGAHDDGTGELTAPLAQVLPGVERAHAVPQQEIGHIRVECFRQHGHGVQVVQHGAVAVRLGKVAVIGFGADGAAVAQMIVPRDEDAPGSQIFGQRLVAVNEFHHAVGELDDGPHLPVRDTAERVERPPGDGGGNGKIDHLAHGTWLLSRCCLQGADLAAAGRADAVALVLHGVGVHLAAEIAAAVGAVFLEDDRITLHEDLQFCVAVQAHAGAQLLGQDDTAKRVNTTNDSSCFHKSYSPFTFYTDERVPNDGVPCRTGPQCPGRRA